MKGFYKGDRKCLLMSEEIHFSRGTRGSEGKQAATAVFPCTHNPFVFIQGNKEDRGTFVWQTDAAWLSYNGATRPLFVSN